ncbi:MAG TPA: glutaredoxin domain-containing protein [Thermoanaerobaculia bacterium]|nr:glutaredoxin domain-containing protein [Thermoanaerobaculia bacterium]
MNQGIRVYGADWCGDTRRTLRQLDQIGVDYAYVDIDQDADGEKKVIEFNKGKRRIPTVELSSTSGDVTLSVPSESELEQELDRLGLMVD